MRLPFVALATMAAACAGRSDVNCPPLPATDDAMTVTVTPEDGCGGATWRADVRYADGRTQVVAGDRNGAILEVMIGDFSGDSLADLVIAVEPGRVFGFVRRGNVLFGRELPRPPGQGSVRLDSGALRAADAVWDVGQGRWMMVR